MRTSAAASIRCACFSGGASRGEPFGNHSRFQVVMRILAVPAIDRAPSQRQRTPIQLLKRVSFALVYITLPFVCENQNERAFALAKSRRIFQDRCMKTTTLSTDLLKRSLLIPLFACSLLVSAKAVSPPPDGGYPGGNTAEGQNALLSLTTGTYNTAVGFFSLNTVTRGNFNTALGAGTLLANDGNPATGEGSQNTATGAGVLLSNSIGAGNTGNGAFALFNNTEGGINTASGAFALFNNTTGNQNTANGANALLSNRYGQLQHGQWLSSSRWQHYRRRKHRDRDQCALFQYHRHRQLRFGFRSWWCCYYGE